MTRGVVTVGIPYRGCPDLVNRAVTSMLGQTYGDVRVLVVGDGDRPPVRCRDSRVEVYTMRRHRGTYFARAVALAATDTPWHAVLDADDWAEPEWIERLLQVEGGAGAVQHCTRRDHYPDGKSRVVRWRRADHEPGPVMGRFTSHVGLYATGRLRDVGGYHPGFQVGYDSLLVALLRITGQVALLGEPLYHRSVRSGSLSSNRSTGMASRARAEVHDRLARLYEQAWPVRGDTDKVRALVQGTWPPLLAAEVAAHAARIGGAA